MAGHKMTPKYQVVYLRGHRPDVIPAYDPNKPQPVTRIGFKK